MFIPRDRFSFRFSTYCCLSLTTKQSIGNCHWYSRFLQGLFSLPNSDRSLTVLSLSQMICFLHHLISPSPLFLCYPAPCFFIYFFQLFRQLYLYLSVIIIFLLICVFLSPCYISPPTLIPDLISKLSSLHPLFFSLPCLIYGMIQRS